MSRKPQVRYFASRNAYYTQIDGKQHKLAEGPDYAAGGPTFIKALEAYKQLLELAAVSTSKDANTVRAVMETYITHQKGKVAETTSDTALYVLRPFVDEYGNMRVGDLTYTHIDNFVAKMRTERKGKKKTLRWGSGAVMNFHKKVTAAMNWALKRRLITYNPLRGMERPKERSRSRDCILTPEQHALMLKRVKAETFRRVIIALENTGCRPSEIVAATAQAWNDEDECLIYYADTTRQEGEFRHKTAAKKDRIIYFTGEALAMMRQLVKEHPTGTLFRTYKGEPYQVRTLVSNFRRMRKRVGLPKLTAYSYRHTRATRWLLAGKSVDILAELLGNTPAVIRKHYAHLMADRKAIRSQLEDFLARVGDPSRFAPWASRQTP